MSAELKDGHGHFDGRCPTCGQECEGCRGAVDAARIAELEEKLSKYRRIVAVPVDTTYTAHLWVPANIDVEAEQERWKSSDSFAPFTDWLISRCSADWAVEVEEMEAAW